MSDPIKAICITLSVVVGLIVCGAVIVQVVVPDRSTDKAAIEALRSVAERSGSSGTSPDAAFILAAGFVAGCGLLLWILADTSERRKAAESPARGETHHHHRETIRERLVIVTDRPDIVAASLLPGGAYHGEQIGYQGFPVVECRRDAWGREA